MLIILTGVSRMHKQKVLFICKYYPPLPSARAYQIGKVVQSIIETDAVDIFVIAGLRISSTTLEDIGTQKYSQNICSIKYVPYHEPVANNRYFSRVIKRVRCELQAVNIGNDWVVEALKESKGMIESKKIDILISSSTPFESHIVGLLLAKEYGLPWIASFSDPWPTSLRPSPYNKYSVPLLSFFQKHYVKKVLMQCDGIHMPNSTAIKFMEKQTSVPIVDKGYAIPHVSNKVTGADKMEDLRGWLVHIGSLNRERVSKDLIKALINVRASHPDEIRGLLLVGIVCPEFRLVVKELNAEEHIRYHGIVSQKEADLIASAAPVLLVLEANMPMSPFLPSKFADYACTQKPIIAITPEESPIRNYFTSYGGGIPVRHDTDEIISALLKVFTRNDGLKQRGNSDKLCLEFTHSTVSKKYIDMFNQVRCKKRRVY